MEISMAMIVVNFLADKSHFYHLKNPNEFTKNRETFWQYIGHQFSL